MLSASIAQIADLVADTTEGAAGEATSPKGADSKSRSSTASGAAGKTASPKGADSKPRPSTASGEAASPKGPFAKPSRPSTASGSDGARREAKEKAETKEVARKGEDKTESKTGAPKATAETSQVAEPAVEKVDEDKAARQKSAEKVAAEKAAKAAPEKAPAEKAPAEKATAEKAAAEKAAAEKAAAEKAAAEKAAADKATAEKAAAEKVAAEKAAAEKAAADKATAEKAAAEKAAAEKAAVEKAAAQKAAAEKAAAEKAAAEKAAAQKAAAEKAAAEKAAAEKAAAEKAAAEKAAAEKAAAEKAAAEKAAAEKAAAEKAAAEKAAAEKAAAEKAAAEKAAAEKVLQATEMKRAEAAEKLRVMTMIRSKLKKKVENVQDQSQSEDMPKLLIFDLERPGLPAATRFQSSAPHGLTGSTQRVTGAGAAVAKPFKEAAEIVLPMGLGLGRLRASPRCGLRQFTGGKDGSKRKDQKGLASKTPPGPGGIEKSIMAIYPGSKTAHFKQIADGSGLEFREMLFFDDRALNVRAAQKLGIVAHQVSSLDGLTWKDFSAGLDAWRAQRRSSLAMSKWLRPKGTTPAGLESSAEPPPVIDLLVEADDPHPTPPGARHLSATAALQEKLDASVLGRLMAEERLEELKLELAEAELKRDEEAEEKAKFLVQMANIPTPQPKGEVAAAPAGEDGAMAALLKLQNRKKKEEAPAPAPPPSAPAATEAPARPNITRSPELDAYQEALRVLHQASQQEVDEMQKQIAILDQDSNKVPRLKTDLKTLNNRQNLLQERMADVEMEAIELEQAAKAGDELRDLRSLMIYDQSFGFTKPKRSPFAAFGGVFPQEVEQREERLQQLEDLVLKLDKERRRLQEEARLPPGFRKKSP
eukprot:s3604_g2.t2